MNKATLKITYTQIIDSSSPNWFEKEVMKASYVEFLLKSQAYNPENRFKTFQQMVEHDGKANALHYKCSFPIVPHVESLKNKIPYLIDNLGKNIQFEKYHFEIIDSDISNPALHKVSITYSTPELTLLENFGEYLLLNYNRLGESGEDDFLLRIAPKMSIKDYLPFVSDMELGDINQNNLRFQA